MKNRRKIRVGIIGTGYFMNRMHLPNIITNPKFELYALCDKDSKRLFETSKKFSAKRVFFDYKELLRDSKIDLVFIGTKGVQHCFFLCEVAKSGKHAFVEKPMTQTIEEADRVIEAFKNASGKIMVGYNRRFAPSMVDAKILFHKNKMAPANLYYRMASIVPDTNYVHNLQEGGGHLVTEGCHIFDLLCWFLESEPISIYSSGGLSSNNNTTIKFSDGSIATFLMSSRAGLCYPKEYFEIFGNNKTIVVDHFVELRTDGLDENAPLKKIYTLREDEIPEIGAMGGIEGHFEKSRFMRKNDLYWLKKVQPRKGHYEELDAYADAILNNRPSPVGAEDGRRATFLALKAMESLRSKEVVVLERKKNIQ